MTPSHSRGGGALSTPRRLGSIFFVVTLAKARVHPTLTRDGSPPARGRLELVESDSRLRGNESVPARRRGPSFYGFPRVTPTRFRDPRTFQALKDSPQRGCACAPHGPRGGRFGAFGIAARML